MPPQVAQLQFPRQPTDQGLQTLVAGASERCPSLQALSMSFQPKLMSSTAGALAAAHLPALKELSLIETGMHVTCVICLQPIALGLLHVSSPSVFRLMRSVQLSCSCQFFVRAGCRCG